MTTCRILIEEISTGIYYGTYNSHIIPQNQRQEIKFCLNHGYISLYSVLKRVNKHNRCKYRIHIYPVRISCGGDFRIVC